MFGIKSLNTELVETLSEVAKLTREDSVQIAVLNERISSLEVGLSSTQARISGLNDARDRIWGRLDDIDKYLQRKRVKVLEEELVMANQIENALHDEIAMKDAMIRGLDTRIISLLAEIRAKNVTIASMTESRDNF
jgi:chromosome segregation ATPase